MSISFLLKLFSYTTKYAILILIKGDDMKKIEQTFNQIIFREMVYSVVFAIIGLIIFLNSDMTNRTAGLLIGTFLLVAGIFNLYTFIDKHKIKLFRFSLYFGIINILLGIFAMFNPLSILNFLNISLGICLIVESINKIIYFLDFKKVGEESKKIILTSSILFLILGIMIIVNPFRSIIITKTIGMFVILYNVLNLNDLVLLKRRSKKFLELLK